MLRMFICLHVSLRLSKSSATLLFSQESFVVFFKRTVLIAPSYLTCIHVSDSSSMKEQMRYRRSLRIPTLEDGVTVGRSARFCLAGGCSVKSGREQTF